MPTPDTTSAARLAREVAREREERHKNDDAKSGSAADEEFRSKDARQSTSSSDLHRSRLR
jgi:hypothetical protein